MWEEEGQKEWRNKCWWDKKVKNATALKKKAFKTLCKTGLEEHKISYRK